MHKGFDGVMDPALLEYLKEMEACGVPARSTGPRARAAARPHQSALSAGPQLYRQLWKDAAAGRILLATSNCWSYVSSLVGLCSTAKRVVSV